ncbi:prenyltransferase/squalene oxidase repeat-containing protein [Paenibacillus herberti]|uniref:Prenyltransferase n=1 Tax=Paenibacillus herberti TaxID=1619309 RepID=A0A229P348_9BACL|nr:prenyltransferase/squalene oxidase repeat-containing protein [Paenibacillus herberti]OXM16299.1 hypothetical protein CGZ75_06340 [Paenibacillus herberti]
MDQSILNRAKPFIYNNARLLDRRKYEFYFEGGSKERVIEALRAYQNPDGGFGNALEPDIRCPNSQPVPIEMALMVMDQMDDFDPRMIDGVIRYLKEITLPDGGFPFVFRSASEYPHAPWWAAQQDDQPSINPTGRILGLLYKQKTRTDIFQEGWFLKNVAYVWSVVENTQPHGYHDAVHWISFLQHTPEQERAGKIWLIFDEWVNRSRIIERNPKAEGYVHKVLDWAPTRDSYMSKFMTDADFAEHVQVLIRDQQEDGGWSINWPAVSSGGEAEWRGSITIDRLLTLRSFGMI